MGRGTGQVDTADTILYGPLPTRKQGISGATQPAEDVFADYKELGLPSQLTKLNGPWEPHYRDKHPEQDLITFNAFRMYLGSDNFVYVLHMRDSYKKGRLGRKKLVREECSITFGGNSISGACDTLNEALRKQKDPEHAFRIGWAGEIGGVSSGGRNPSRPYTPDEIVGRLEKISGKNFNAEREQQVLKEFALHL